MKLADLGAPLARGGVSELYAWRDGQVLKLFQRGFAASAARNEARVTAKLHALGLRVPAVGEPVEIEGRHGFPMERLEGAMLAERALESAEDAASAARVLAGLQAEMHARREPSLPAGRALFEALLSRSDRLSPALRERALHGLAGLSEEDAVCHGDFHAGNVFVTGSGPFAIDCATAHRGNPRLDAAQTWVAMTEWLSSAQSEPRRAAIRVFLEQYEKEYFALRPHGRAEFERAKPVVAAVRLTLPHPATSDAPLRRIAETGTQDSSL